MSERNSLDVPLTRLVMEMASVESRSGKTEYLTSCLKRKKGLFRKCYPKRYPKPQIAKLKGCNTLCLGGIATVTLAKAGNIRVSTKEGLTKMANPLKFLWCRRRDLNPHGRNPLPPQDSVSTSFHHFGIMNLAPLRSAIGLPWHALHIDYYVASRPAGSSR